jgi:hypothetical protein
MKLTTAFVLFFLTLGHTQASTILLDTSTYNHSWKLNYVSNSSAMKGVVAGLPNDCQDLFSLVKSYYVKAISKDSGKIQRYHEVLEDLTNPIQIKSTCSKVTVNVRSQIYVKNGTYPGVEFFTEATCDARSFSERVTYKLAKDCEKTPSSECLAPGVKETIDPVQDTEVVFNLGKDFCSGKDILFSN